MKIEISRENELKKFKIQGKPLIANRDYFVLTSDYLQKGGDNMNFFKKSDSIFTLDLKIRDILIDFFSNKDSLDIKSDNRFIYTN
jgi:5'-nucleotidase